MVPNRPVTLVPIGEEVTCPDCNQGRRQHDRDGTGCTGGRSYNSLSPSNYPEGYQQNRRTS